MNVAQAFLFAAIVAGSAAAQEFPTRPLRLVVPNPAGGTVDLVARAVAQAIAPALGQSVFVEPKPGANTVIGSEAVARSAADGHTLLMVSTSFAINALVRSTPYAPSDFTAVARLTTVPFVFAVHPSLEARSVGDLVRLAKARPGQLHYATFGLGQLAGETFKSLAGIDLGYVPYQGGVNATTSVLGGHVGLLIAPLSDAGGHIAVGKLRALAVTSLQRSEGMTDLPTVAESGYPGFDWVAWIGAVAPAGTPKAAVARLSAEMLRAIDSPQLKDTLLKQGISPAPMPPGAFSEFIGAQTSLYDTVMKRTNIKLQ